MAIFYRTYNFVDKDPVIDILRTAWEDSGLTLDDVAKLSGVSASTLYNWFHGNTKRPQYATVMAVGRALGGDFRWIKKRKLEKAA